MREMERTQHFGIEFKRNEKKNYLHNCNMKKKKKIISIYTTLQQEKSVLRMMIKTKIAFQSFFLFFFVYKWRNEKKIKENNP